MGNVPSMGVDPDGQSVVLAAIAIGALIGGHINGTMYGMQGKNYLDGFWRGAIVGGVGGAFGAFAPIGALPGAIYGAGSGAITGGLGAALNGGNVGKGALYGAAGGAVIGGLSGGIQAHKLGANPWSGYRAPHDMLANDILTDSFVENKLEYSENKLNEFNKEKFSSVNSKYKFSIKPPKNYTLNDNVFYNPKNERVVGATVSSIWKGGSSGTIHMAPMAFHSPETMFITMGHELGHSIIHSLGGQTFSNWEQHQSIFNWELKAANVNGWTKYIQNFMRTQNYPIIWTDPHLDKLILKLPFKF
jgi:hypothetical protein